nr:MAG TPA: tail assembly chaperone [Caudoviricetes sp.]
MEQLRIQRKDVYEIQVNDEGDTIRFNLGDLELPFKLEKAANDITKIQNDLKSRLVVIDKQKDSKGKNDLMSKNQRDKLNAWKNAYNKMRTAMDGFLGEGGCQKIFGDSNYLEMFDDLFDELDRPQADGKSHLENMRLSDEAIVKRIEDKYKSAKNKQVI